MANRFRKLAEAIDQKQAVQNRETVLEMVQDLKDRFRKVLFMYRDYRDTKRYMTRMAKLVGTFDKAEQAIKEENQSVLSKSKGGD